MIEQFQMTIAAISTKTFFWLLVLLTGLLFFVGLNSRQLYGSDEPRVAGIAAETTIYGNWLEPSLNSKPFLEKPPLYLWADSLSIKTFGHNAFAAKLPSAVSAFLGVLAIFWLAIKLGGSGLTAFTAGIVLATSAQYWSYGRKCMIDIMLAVFIAGAFWTFYQLVQSKKFNIRLWWALGLSITLGGALFAKGLVGVAIPAVAIGGWLAIRDIANRQLTLADWIWFAIATLGAFIPVSIWLWLLYDQSGYDAVYTVVWTNNFGRFTGGHAEHIEPFYYYLTKLPEQLQPWTILLPFAVIYAWLKFWHEERGSKTNSYPYLYMLCWLIIPYLLLTKSAGKRQVYILPLYAAEALMIGFMIANFLEGKLQLPAKLNREKIISYGATFLTLITLLFPLVIFVVNWVRGTTGVTVVLLALIGGIIGIVTLNSWLKKNLARLLLGFVFALCCGFITVDMTLRTQTGNSNSYRSAFDYALKQQKQGQMIVLFRPREGLSGAAIFYLKHRIKTGGSLEWLRQQLSDKNMQIMILDKQLASFERLNEPLMNKDYRILKSFKIKRRQLLIIAGTIDKLDE